MNKVTCTCGHEVKSLSKCCKAEITVLIDSMSGECTMCYICTSCKKECDIISNHPKSVAPEYENQVVTTDTNKIGMLRVWLNEDRITDPKRLVTNEDLLRWLVEQK